MKFKTVQDAFNHYRTATIEQMEQRAAEIKGTIDTDPSADIMSLNIEIEGLNEAMQNAAEKEQQDAEQEPEGRGSWNPLTRRSFRQSATPATGSDIFASAEYRSAFYKQMLQRPLSAADQNVLGRAYDVVVAEGRADAFGTTENTPAVVPTQTLNEVISKARTEGGILSVARHFNIPANLVVPIGIPQPPANVHEEGECIETDRPDVVDLEFGAHEIMKIFSISNKLQHMSIPAFESYLIEELYSNYMARIEIWAAAGTGTNEGKGVANISFGDNLVEYSGEPTYKDFVTAIGKLKRGYSKNAVWVMNNYTLFAYAYGLTDSTGRPIYLENTQNQGVDRMLTKPVIVDDNLADGEIFIGDFNYYGVNMVQAPMIEISRHSSFHCGKIDYRVIGIADSKPIVDEAFVLLAPGEDVGA